MAPGPMANRAGRGLPGRPGVLFGRVPFAWPGITAVVLLYLIAFWAIGTGVAEIVAAFQLRRHVEGEGALALGGVLSVLFGVVLLVAPGAGALALVYIIGAYALLFGVL